MTGRFRNVTDNRILCLTPHLKPCYRPNLLATEYKNLAESTSLSEQQQQIVMQYDPIIGEDTIGAKLWVVGDIVIITSFTSFKHLLMALNSVFMVLPSVSPVKTLGSNFLNISLY